MRREPFVPPEPLIRRVYAYVAYRIGDGPDAEDVTSATFERALRYRDSFDAEKGEPAAWLIGIARRLLAEERPAVLSGEVEEVEAPMDLEAETIDRVTVQSLVRRLDGRDRELIALRYGADLSAAQIAEMLDLRPNTVEVALHRALERLRPLAASERREPSRNGAAASASVSS